jgi:methionyl-tRNA synthetase
MEPKRYLITAALPYANGPLHFGHIAGCYLPADIYVRYLRLKGRDVVFVGGSDEHGVPVTISAKKEGVTPQDVVDKYHNMMKNAFEEFGISYNIYARTTSKTHHELASDFFKTLYEKNAFTEQVSHQYYDEQEKQFLADRYIEGTCPKCSNEKAYGDQCEKCGATLSPEELINPKSKLSGNKPILKETKHWYLPLNDYTPWLREWILQGHKQDWKANVYGQCKSWIDSPEGLQPRAMTRDLEWGIPVPVKGAEGKVLYVWFDAPIGYISATKEYTADWEKYWKDKDTKLVHFIGKDNIVFHCIIFPVILKAHGDYIMPENVPANEFLNLEGEKFSTSRNWAAWLHEYLIDFKDKQDVLRYVLCANAPETKDNDFTWKDFQARNNNELVAILGNFINRTMVLTHKYYEGRVPAASTLHDYDKQVLAEMAAFPDKIAHSIENYRFREALTELMNLARLGNKYLADTEPWKLIKTDAERVKTIMHISLQLSACLTVLMEPFLPFSAGKLANMLNLSKKQWDDAKSVVLLNEGHQLNEAHLLYDKIEDADIEKQLTKLQTSKDNLANAAASIQPSKTEVVFDDFLKLDIRTATIIAAERVPKTEKLLKLQVDTGIDVRTVVSGIAEYYKPENIIGQKVSILVNLAPRKIKGIESQGMILMAENPQGKLAFILPDSEMINGSIIR